MRSTLRRVVLLLAAAAIVPACHDGSSSGGGAGLGAWLYQNISNVSLSNPNTWDGDVDWMDCEHVCVDGRGWLHAVWYENTNNNPILWYARSTDGRTWSTPVSIWAAGPTFDFVIACGSDGSAYVAWITGSIMGGTDVYMRRVSATGVLSVGMDVSEGPTTPTAVDQLALRSNDADDLMASVAADGTVHVLWSEDDDNGDWQLWHRAMNFAANTASSIERVSDATAGNGDGTPNNGSYDYDGNANVAIDRSGNVHVTFTVDIDDGTDDRNDEVDGNAPNAVLDGADDFVDRYTGIYRFRGNGVAGTWGGAQFPLPAASVATRFPLAAGFGNEVVESIRGGELMVDDAGRVHICVAVDRGETNNNTDANGISFNTGPDDMFYNVRSAGAAGTWGTVDAVSRSADVPGGDLDLLDDTNNADLFCCTVNPATGEAHIAWIDRDAVAASAVNLDGQTWYLRYKSRDIGGALFSAQTSTLLDSSVTNDNPDMDQMCCGVDGAGNLTLVYERESQGTAWWGGSQEFRTVRAAYIRQGVAFNPSVDLRELSSAADGGTSAWAQIYCCDFRYGRAIVMIGMNEGTYGNWSPWVTTHASGTADWSALYQIDREVDAANGLPDDAWGDSAGAVAITPNGLYHAFFDQFATHPTPVDSLNDLPDWGGNSLDVINDPDQYIDPNSIPDSYDLFHSVSDR